MSPPLQIYLVRHGQTAWSLTGQHTGLTDLPLTATGDAMARELAPLLGTIRFSRVLSSPRLRARTTCEAAGLGERAETVADLAEWDYGEFEGLRSTEIRQRHPGWDLWRDGCPGGESPAQIGERADRLIAQLRAMSGPVALFSHGQFGRSLAMRWIGLPVAQAQHFMLDPASISVLADDGAHPPQAVIALWNAGRTGIEFIPDVAADVIPAEGATATPRSRTAGP
jgi:probable phosphoglycerate mutase